MNSTYIDITQLVHWPGRLTGIPRVMNELAVRYAARDDVAFVVWDASTRCFFELDIASSLGKRGEGIFYKLPAGAEGHSEAPTRTASVMVRGLKKAGRVIKERNPELYQALTARARRYVPAPAGVPVAFTPGDELFILWGEWADESFQKAVVAAHNGAVNIVHIVYDMLPVLAPQFSGHSTEAMDRYYRHVIPLCRVVLAISESTKKDLAGWLKKQHLHVPNIQTFRLGEDFAVIQATAPEKTVLSRVSPSGEPFLLCVGTVEARKNHTLLYYVYKLAHSRGITLPVVAVVGRKGWKTDNIYDIITTDPEVKDKIVFLENVSDEELAWFYKHCRFTVYPSFYEGWGLPIAESIAHGKTCLASETSSMPEIAGDAIDYFNPASSEECLKKITSLLDDAYLKKCQTRLGRYKASTWDNTYQQVKMIVEGGK